MKITSRRTTRPLNDPKASEFGSKLSSGPGNGSNGNNDKNEVSESDVSKSQLNQQNQSNKTEYKYLKLTRKLDEAEMEASRILQDLASRKLTSLKPSDIQPGNLIYFKYQAKGAESDRDFVYDKTPFSFFLASGHSTGGGGTHILGLNLHWLPKPIRKTIMNAIIKVGRSEIKRGKIPIIKYNDLRPVLKNTGAIYAVRLYIKSRISSKGIVVPPDLFIKTAENVPPEQITNGYSAEQVYKLALRKVKQTKSKKGSRYKRTL